MSATMNRFAAIQGRSSLFAARWRPATTSLFQGLADSTVLGDGSAHARTGRTSSPMARGRRGRTGRPVVRFRLTERGFIEVRLEQGCKGRPGPAPLPRPDCSSDRAVFEER